MTKLDILILVVFVASVAWGFRKGVIEQAGALGGILLGVVLCRIGSPWMIAVLAGEAEPTYVDSVLARINLYAAIKPQTDWQALSHIGNGHAIDAIVGFAPCLLGQFTN